MVSFTLVTNELRTQNTLDINFSILTQTKYTYKLLLESISEAYRAFPTSHSFRNLLQTTTEPANSSLFYIPFLFLATVVTKQKQKKQTHSNVLYFILWTFHLRFPAHGRRSAKETTHSFRNPMTSLLFRGLFNVFYFALEQVRNGPFYLRPMKGNANSFLSGLNYFVVIWLCSCLERGKMSLWLLFCKFYFKKLTEAEGLGEIGKCLFFWLRANGNETVFYKKQFQVAPLLRTHYWQVLKSKSHWHSR